MTIEMFPPRANSLHSFSVQHPPGDQPDETPPGGSPSQSDDQLGMAWWNALNEKDRRRWMRLAGDTGRAVDAWRAFKAADRLTGRVEQDERSWLVGYDAAYAAKLAGKPTPQAPHGVDGFSYASGAVEGAAAGERDTSPAGSFLRLAERELDPRDVIAEILEEHLVMDPRAVADAIVEHLRDAGFVIKPAEE